MMVMIAHDQTFFSQMKKKKVGQRGGVDVEMMPFKQEFNWHLLRFLYVSTLQI
jgi:hypothetical protein